MAETDAVLETRRAQSRAWAARYQAVAAARRIEQPWLAFSVKHDRATRSATAVVVLACGCVVEAVVAAHPADESLARSARGCKQGHAGMRWETTEPGSTNGSSNRDSPGKDYGSSASTATARADSSGSARTRGEFTPGPWEVDRHGAVVALVDRARRQVALACGEAPMHDDRSAEPPSTEVIQAANARLIAAAPDLLAELEALEKALALSDADAYGLQPETADRLNGLRCRAQAVLRKARGTP